MADVAAGASPAARVRASGCRGFHHCEGSIFQRLFCVIVDWRNSALSTRIITRKVEGVFIRWRARAGPSRHGPLSRELGRPSRGPRGAVCARARVAPGWAELPARGPRGTI